VLRVPLSCAHRYKVLPCASTRTRPRLLGPTLTTAPAGLPAASAAPASSPATSAATAAPSSLVLRFMVIRPPELVFRDDPSRFARGFQCDFVPFAWANRSCRDRIEACAGGRLTGRR